MAIRRLNISSIRRSIVGGNALSSKVLSSLIEELTTDFGSIATQWNGEMVPLLATVPNGNQDSAINAFINGLDSKTIYGDSRATNTASALRYFNVGRNRPKTIYEILEDLYDLISTAGSGSSTTIIQGGLTDAQKARIGINIFDSSQVSSAGSLDGLTARNVLNLDQLAIDLYGTASVLNESGTGILTFPVRDMVDALLELHGGDWSNDIVMSHADIPELAAIRTFIGQDTVTTTAPNYSSTNYVSQGSNLETAIGALDAAISGVGGGDLTQVVANYTELRAINNALGDYAIVLGRTAAGDGGEGLFVWDPNSSLTDNDGTIIDPSPGGNGRWLRQYNGPQSLKWFGAIPSTQGITDKWTDGGSSHLTARITTTNNLVYTGLALPVNSADILRADVKIVCAESTTSYSSHNLALTFSTAATSSGLMTIVDEFYTGATQWYPLLTHDTSNFYILVSGKSATTLNWRMSVDLLGVDF